MSAYWIAHVTVTEPEAYARYQAAARGVFEAYGGTFLVRGGESDALEGASYARHVIVAFETLEQARACYASEQYRAARLLRVGAADVHITLVAGA